MEKPRYILGTQAKLHRIEGIISLLLKSKFKISMSLGQKQQKLDLPMGCMLNMLNLEVCDKILKIEWLEKTLSCDIYIHPDFTDKNIVTVLPNNSYTPIGTYLQQYNASDVITGIIWSVVLDLARCATILRIATGIRAHMSHHQLTHEDIIQVKQGKGGRKSRSKIHPARRDTLIGPR